MLINLICKGLVSLVCFIDVCMIDELSFILAVRLAQMSLFDY